MEWKTINNFENYLVSDSGLVMNNRTKRILKPKVTKTGYHIVTLSKNNEKTPLLVHRLVAEAFIPNPQNKPCVDHIIPTRNGGTDNVLNLRWCTPKENSNNPSTLQNLMNNNTQKMQVYQYDLNNNLVATYQSLSEAARVNSFSQGNIHRCINGGYFRKDRCNGKWQKINMYKGFKWSYNPL